MKIILDTNIFLSALIKDSTGRKILVTSGWEFYYPEISLHEVRKHQGLVMEKSGMEKHVYEKLINSLLAYTSLVPDEPIRKNVDEAKKIMAQSDENDVVFVAACLSIPHSIIWSDDVDFDRQSKVKILKSKEMYSFFSR